MSSRPSARITLGQLGRAVGLSRTALLYYESLGLLVPQYADIRVRAFAIRCLNQLPDGLSPTGAHAGCVSADGIYDMMGNLHEWTAAPSGTFRGGYYLDTKLNGEGCDYRTTAHAPAYYDYSTGFRCCADVGSTSSSAPTGYSRKPSRHTRQRMTPKQKNSF